AKFITYYSEGFRASMLNRLAGSLGNLEEELSKKEPNKDTVKKFINILKRNQAAVKKSMVPKMEQDIFATMARLIYTDVPKGQLPDVYINTIFKNNKEEDLERTFKNYAQHIFSKTFLLDSARFNAFVNNPTLPVLKNDPAAEFALSFIH